MEYKNRTYRDSQGNERWHTFTVIHKEIDLWISVDKPSFSPEIVSFVQKHIEDLRTLMNDYLLTDPNYKTSLIPYIPLVNAPEIFFKMSEVALKSGIGPMSAVAGSVAMNVAQKIKKTFKVKEIIIENGGDIYADTQKDFDISVFAGPSPLSEKVGFRIPHTETPLGICTSSGTVGPSLSFGKADAVMIICKDCALADTFATAFANRIQTKNDIENCIQQLERTENILAAVCIKDDKIGIVGKFDLKIWK